MSKADKLREEELRARERDLGESNARLVTANRRADELAQQLTYERELHKRCSDQDGRDRLAAIERAERLAADVLELEARLRLAKSAALSAAQVAQVALARVELYTRIVRAARDWVLPPLSIIATRELCAAVQALEAELAKRANS